VIPQRELRDNVSDDPRVDVDRATLRRLLVGPVDAELVDDLDAGEAPLDDPSPA
jgi:hypothetical protein